MPESAQYAQKAADLYQKLGYRSMEADALSFAGHGLRLSGKLDQSLEYFEKGNQTARQLNDTAMLVQSMIDLASYYAESNDYQQAIQYYLDGIAISDTTRWRQQMLLYGNLGQIYMYDGQHAKALPGLKMALKLSQQQDDDFFLTEWPEYIAQAHAGLNQYDSAYKYMKIAWISTDTIFTKDKNEALEEMRTRFETEKKEATISYQQAELGRQKTIQWLIVGILALTLLILYLVYRNAARTKANMALIRNKNEALKQQNEKIALLLKEIHHRTKNNMQMVSSLLNMQSMHVEDAKALDAVEASQNRVQSMALIHQKLYQGKDLISIDMQDYIQSLTDYLASSLQSTDRNVDFTVQLPELIELDVDSAVSVGLILNELITNSYKYAFAEKESAHIKIGLVKKQENNVQLIFEDNGKGKHSQIQGTGFGSQLISILVKQLKADMKEWNDQGYHVSLSFQTKKISDLAA
jgi:two-component sensor histidine kinase